METIRRRLGEGEESRLRVTEAASWSAVAAVLRQEHGSETEVLLIRRAQKEGDPWSGQMAFPGGHAQPEDADLYATALRETREEIGLDLQRDGELIGRLDDIRVTARGRHTGMVITPHVFVLHGDPEFSISDEVAELLWSPLGPMARGDVDTVAEYWLDGTRLDLPAYDAAGRIVWGLTYAMLRNLFARVAAC